MKFIIMLEDVKHEDGSDGVQIMLKSDEQFDPKVANPDEVTPAAFVMMTMMVAGSEKLNEICDEINSEVVGKFN